MTPEELRALAEDDAKLLEVSCEFVSDLARLCAELGEALERIASREEPPECHEPSCAHSDAGLGHCVCGCYADSGPHLEHYCDAAPDAVASAAVAKLAELEAR